MAAETQRSQRIHRLIVFSATSASLRPFLPFFNSKDLEYPDRHPRRNRADRISEESHGEWMANRGPSGHHPHGFNAGRRQERRVQERPGRPRPLVRIAERGPRRRIALRRRRRESQGQTRPHPQGQDRRQGEGVVTPDRRTVARPDVVRRYPRSAKGDRGFQDLGQAGHGLHRRNRRPRIPVSAAVRRYRRIAPRLIRSVRHPHGDDVLQGCVRQVRDQGGFPDDGRGEGGGRSVFAHRLVAREPQTIRIDARRLLRPRDRRRHRQVPGEGEVHGRGGQEINRHRAAPGPEGRRSGADRSHRLFRRGPRRAGEEVRREGRGRLRQAEGGRRRPARHDDEK